MELLGGMCGNDCENYPNCSKKSALMEEIKAYNGRKHIAFEKSQGKQVSQEKKGHHKL